MGGAGRPDAGRNQGEGVGVGRPQRFNLERRTHATADPGRRRQLRQPRHIGRHGLRDGQLAGEAGRIPAGEHRHRQQGGCRQTGCRGRLLRRALRRRQGLTAGAGVHGDQLSAQPGRAAAGTGHGGGDVVELEIQKHPLPLIPQLPHHIRPAGHKQFQAHLHPAQVGHSPREGQGLLRGHAIEGHDDPIGRIKADARRHQPATSRRNVFLPSCSTLPCRAAASANSWFGSASFSPSSFTPPPWIWRRASLLLAQRPTALSR